VPIVAAPQNGPGPRNQRRGEYSVGTYVQDKGFARAAVTVKDNVATPDKVELKLAMRPGGKK
jgi:hypothetical protein